jgi:phosphatidylglycerol:prolipoprotein diacylglycerol transferase
VLFTIWGGLLGAFLARVALSLSQSLALTGEAHAHSGLSFVGVIVGGAAVGLVWARRQPFPLMRGLDLGWTVLPLGQAIGRVGCIGAGCCCGKPTGGALALYLPDASGAWAWRYPTQWMALIANLLIFFTLLAVERYGKRRVPPGHTWPFDGFLFLLYVELYTLKRFSLEFLRADARPVWGPFTVTHLLCGAIIATVTLYITHRLYKRDVSYAGSL